MRSRCPINLKIDMTHVWTCIFFIWAGLPFHLYDKIVNIYYYFLTKLFYFIFTSLYEFTTYQVIMLGDISLLFQGFVKFTCVETNMIFY